MERRDRERESGPLSTIGTDPTTSPDRGSLIAFSRVLPDEGEQLFTMRPDGTDLRQITGAAQGQNSSPSWSPDGARICFVSDRSGHGRLYVMHRDGSGQGPLTTPHDADDDFPDWSPDGRTIAFSRGNTAGPEDLYLLDLECGAEHRLTASALMDYSASWSPDGRHIALRRSFAAPPGIYVIASAGGNAEFLTSGYCPSWSPLGDRIAYSYAAHIWVIPVDADGRAAGAPIELTHDGGSYDRHPCWSPDGACIAFEAELPQDDRSARHILVMRAEGGDLTGLGDGRMPDWSPSTTL